MLSLAFSASDSMAALVSEAAIEARASRLTSAVDGRSGASEVVAVEVAFDARGGRQERLGRSASSSGATPRRARPSGNGRRASQSGDFRATSAARRP